MPLMKFLSDLNRNARVSLAALPAWSVFWGLVYYYSPLYMKSLGMDEVRIGAVNTAGMVMAFLCYILASPITNRFGRKRTTLAFDLISWAAPMLIWAVAGNYWFFLAAGMINALSKVSSISWNCLITEDEETEKVPRIFTMVSLVNSAIGIFVPLAGFFIARFGMVGSMRVLYAVGAVCMAAMFVARDRFVSETRPGAKLMADHGGSSIPKILREQLKLARRLAKDGEFALLSLVFIATNFIASLNLFQVIFLRERLSFSVWSVSLVPFAVALSNIAVFAFVLPRLKKARNEATLAAAVALNLVASLLFLLIPARSLPAMLAVMALNGAANFVVLGYRESVFMERSGEHEKADRYSAVQALTFFFSIPAGYLGGLLYRLNPLLPFALASVLYAVALAAALAFGAARRRA
jgi:MFS family permease